MINFITFLDTINSTEEICSELRPVLRIVGYIFLLIKIAVPIILILVGALGLAKAATEKEEKNIKAAQNQLVRQVVMAVCVFLVATVVSVLMKLIGDTRYEECMDCITSPSHCEVIDVTE